MRIAKMLSSLFAAIIFAFSFSACSTVVEDFSFVGFNTQIIVFTPGKSLSSSMKSSIKTIVSDLEKEFDGNDSDSMINAFNDMPAGQSISISDRAVHVLSGAKKAYSLSGGKFDPTVYPLVKLWGFAPYSYTPNFIPPTEQDVIIAKNAVGFDDVIVDAAAKTLSKTRSEVKLDFGGIVKGYAADLIANLLLENGYSDGYVSVGGSSLNLLKVNKLNIRHPEKNSQAIIEINCKDQINLSVSTSGNYEKFHFTTDGKKYCHIIDPQTGYPADNGVLSATIVGIDGILSDALTTALCLCDFDIEIANESPLVQFINRLLLEYNKASIFVVFSAENDKIILTNKEQGKDFSLLDQEYSIYKI